MNKVILVVAALCLLATVYFGRAVLAGEEEGIVAQVTTVDEIVSVTLSDSSINYGSVVYGGTSNPSQEITATNTGNVIEDFDIKGATAYKQGDASCFWTIAAHSNPDAYEHWVGHSTYTFPVDYDQLSANYIDLGNNIAVGGVDNFKTVLVMPTSSTCVGVYETQLTVRATKHL